MTLGEATRIAKEMNLGEDENGLTFKAAVLILMGINHNTCSYSKLKKLTCYWWKEVVFILNNFWANGIIYEYKWNLGDSEDEVEIFFEIVLCAMSGAGELVRVNPDIQPAEKSYKWEDFLERTEFCKGQYTSSHYLKMDIDEVRKLNAAKREIQKSAVPIPQETPQWLIEKQQRIKEIAAKFEAQ